MSYGQYNPYSQGPPQDDNQGWGQANPYGGDQHELQNINYGQQQPQSGNALSLPEFLGRVDQLQNDLNTFDGSLNEYSRLFQQNLASTDATGEAELKNRLAQMQGSLGNIHNGIQLLKQDFTLSLRDNANPQAKRSHLETLQKNMKALQNRYNNITQRNQQALDKQKTRQYLLVYPNATSEEVEQAVSADWGNEGVFQTMLMSSRNDHARGILGNVQARQKEFQSMEQDIFELAQLSQEVALMVEQQDEHIVTIEQNADHTVDNMEAGNQQVKVATEHARRARKLKWWCLLICIIIIVVVALGVGLGICLNSNKCGSK